VDVIKGEGVVQGQLVELGYREVVEEAPGLAPVARFIHPPVAPFEDVVGFSLDKGYGVVVDVLVLLA
jgi:hypothetical protein